MTQRFALGRGFFFSLFAGLLLGQLSLATHQHAFDAEIPHHFPAAECSVCVLASAGEDDPPVIPSHNGFSAIRDTLQLAAGPFRSDAARAPQARLHGQRAPPLLIPLS
jgi:hypothetical protein